jgi:hypothetical protein
MHTHKLRSTGIYIGCDRLHLCMTNFMSMRACANFCVVSVRILTLRRCVSTQEKA